MTELEKYVEDMRKNMSSNQLEMKEYFIQLAKALDADLKAREIEELQKEGEKQLKFKFSPIESSNSLLDHIPLSMLLKSMKDFSIFRYKGDEGVLEVKKFPK